MQLDFLNPITLVIGKSIFGSELKKARLISIDYPLPSQRGSNRNTEQLKGWAATFARHLNVELSFATESEFMLKPSEIIEFSKYRTTFYSGHHVILTGSDSYCALGFESQKEFRVTKKRLEHAWNKTIFKVGDYVYGIKLSTGRKQFENNPSSIDLDLGELKIAMRKLGMELLSNLKTEINFDTNKNYLLVLPYRHDQINNSFSKKFFDNVKKEAKIRDLNVIIKNHPNDTYNYRSYFNTEDGNIFLESELDRHIPVEILLRQEYIKFVITVPSSALAFADLSSLLVLGPKNKNMYRKKFLDQIPFLDRLEIEMTLI